jgi:hypothetical protein
MSIQPKKYVRKALIVVGVEVTNENFMELALWVQGSIFNIDGTQGGQIDPDNQYIMVRVHNPKSLRQNKAFVGDWILHSDRGYKVYTPKAFNNTFDPYVAVEYKPEQVEEKYSASYRVAKSEVAYEEPGDPVRYPTVENKKEKVDLADDPLHNEQDDAPLEAVEPGVSNYDAYLDQKDREIEDGE